MYMCAHKCKGRVKVYDHPYTYLNVCAAYGARSEI